LCVTSHARAEDVHLPLTGLLVALPDAPDVHYDVSAHWSPATAPFEPASGEDVLVVTRPTGATTYRIEVGGRTDRPCPLDNPFVVELDDRPWVHDPTTHTLCHLENDARLEVHIVSDPPPTDDLEPHRVILSALLDAFDQRRVDPHASPPLRDPRVLREGDHAAPALVLPTIGLTLTTPDDGAVWRVAHVREGRWFDALVRVFPTFPEVQLLVYRHARSDIASCSALAQRQVARGPWEPTARATIERTMGRFTIVEHCTQTRAELLEVRVASAPMITGPELDPMLAALAAAAWSQPMPALPATIAARDFQLRWGSAALGVMLPESRADRAYTNAELGFLYARRNGVFLRGVARFGATLDGALGGGSVDVGIALAADRELTLVLALGVREDLDPLLENRTVSASLELYSGFGQDRAFAWALRFVPFHVAGRQSAVAGAPLAIAWDGVFASGLLLGVDLRWVDRPDQPRPGWLGSGVALGLRVGFGDVVR